MTYTLNAALDRIVAIQAAIAITSPVVLAVVVAHKDPPGALQDLPCFINTIAVPEVTSGPGSQRTIYTVKMQFFGRDEKASDASAIARAFLEATKAAFNADVTLNAKCTVALLVGGGAVTGLQYAGTAYIGFELPLRVVMHEAVTFA
ncbi:MAG: hypothetical protein A2Z17_06860 [Gammaproteobacteria bacterium RBG_16_66_13]|nr:MAG: hypothetical protein A2Z17_06860 [Gammaproteobacteria bacterium RBG_16_66_13]